jgi:hypothetical protein
MVLIILFDIANTGLYSGMHPMASVAPIQIIFNPRSSGLMGEY